MRAAAIVLLTPFLAALSPAGVAATGDLIEHKVSTSEVTHAGRSAIRVVEAAASVHEDKIAIFADSNLRNGTISGYVSGGLNAEAGAQARGFVGIAFRINEDVSAFEAVYLRPTNARAEDQLRRNHSIQYISFPDHPWHRLRKESPGRYESYADMVPDQWIHYALTVEGETARLYLDGAEQPALIVNDLKLGTGAGRVGLWIGPGTQAHFSDITIEAR